MSRPALLLLTLSLAALAGCANVPEQNAQAAAPKVRCERETQIGSMMPKKDCGPAVSDDERRRLADELRNQTKPSGITAPGK